jgi:hypothetical protein
MATLIAHSPFRWRRSSLAETDASDLASAACYRGPEHVGIATVVIPELKFRDVKRHIFGADFVEASDDAALEDAPKAFNRIRVHRTDNVLFGAVLDRFVRVFAKAFVGNLFIGCEQADFAGNRLADEFLQIASREALQNAGDNVAATLHSADNDSLGRIGSTLAALAFVPVTLFAADKRLVHFHDAAKLDLWRDQSRPDFVAHGMGRLVAAEAHHALNLKGAHSLLAGQHQMGDAVPVTQGLFGVLKNRARQSGEAIALWGTLTALPVKRLVARGVIQLGIAAARAIDAFRPAPRHEVVKASRVVTNREKVLELGGGHLRDWLRTFCHGGYLSILNVGGYCHG